MIIIIIIIGQSSNHIGAVNTWSSFVMCFLPHEMTNYRIGREKLRRVEKSGVC